MTCVVNNKILISGSILNFYTILNLFSGGIDPLINYYLVLWVLIK